MPEPIRHKRSSTQGAVPNAGDLQTGELAINTTDAKLFTLKEDGTVAQVGGLFGTAAGTYCEGNDSRLSDARPPASHTHGNLTNDGKIGSTANLPVITTTSGALTTGSFGSSANTFCQGNDSRLSDARTPTSHTHGNITNDGKIGITSGVPIITGTSGVLQAGSFGTTSGTFCEGNDSRLSDARTPTSHAHGNITNAGAIGTTANLPVITTTSGVLTTGSFGSSANTFCQGNDSRLSDARTPTAHTHGNITNDGKIGITAGVPIITGTSGVLQAGAFGNTAGSFCEGNDSRLSDARTPTSHSHGNITNAGAIGSTANLPVITTTSGVLTTGSFGSSANTFCQGNDSRLSDTRNTTNSLTFNSGGTGDTSGTTFNGSAAKTISYNTIGAAASNQTMYIGTTGVAINRASASLSLTGVSIDGNAGTVTNGVYTNGSYSDPAWLTISKSKVGLGSVENTALSTWAGSTNITTLGTISTGTVPAANVSGLAASATTNALNATNISSGTLNAARLPSVNIGTTSVDLTRTSGSLSLTGVSIDGSAGSVAWSNVSSKPTTISGYGITDAYTKTEVDGFIQGLDIKASVKAASTANLTLSGTQTIDGVALVAGDRVLVKNQSSASANGIYVVASGAWSRATDFDAWSEVPGAFTFVEQGTTNADSGWVCTSDAGGTIGVTAISFSQFSGAGQITAGAGLSKSGNTLSITDSAVTPATYGSASQVGTFTVDQQGRLTAAGNTNIAISAGAVSGLAASATTNALDATNISSGTLAAARLPSVYIGTTFVNLARVSGSLSLTGVSIDGNAGTVTNGVYTSGSYSDPAWLTISKSKVGLGSVENTALSTWAGSSNITTIGTLASGTVPWSLVGSKPTTLSGYGITDAAPAASPTFTGVVTVPAGTAAAPSITITGDTNTGIYSSGADSIDVATGGSRRLTVNASGNVGIGTASPDDRLHLAAASGVAMRLESTTTALGLDVAVGEIEFEANDASAQGTGIKAKLGAYSDVAAGNVVSLRMFAGAQSETTGTERYRISGDGQHIFGGVGGISTAESLRIDSSGRLLLGTSSSYNSYLLQVEGTSTTNGWMSSRRNSDDTFGSVLSLNKSRGTTAGSTTVIRAGDVVGQLSFRGADGTTDLQAASIQCYSDGAATTTTAGSFVVGRRYKIATLGTTDFTLIGASANTVGTIFSATGAGSGTGTATSEPYTNSMPGRLMFNTTADGASSGTERMRIDSKGLVAIGPNSGSGAALSTTAPAKFYIDNGSYTDITTAASGTVSHGTIVAFENPAINSTNASVTYTNASTVYIDGAPTGTGNVTVTNGFALYVNAGRCHFGGSVLSASATDGVGYKTGAGGTVSQATSRTTGVTINKICGAITLVSAAGSTSWQTFTVTNSTVAATDTVKICQQSGTDKYMAHVTRVAAGAFDITYATTGGTTTEQPVFNFSVIKAVAA